MPRYGFITGGGVSSLGKGLASAALGALLVLPIIANLVAGLTKTQWVQDAGHYLISNAGTGLAGVTNGTLEPWANVVTVLAWAIWGFGALAVVALAFGARMVVGLLTRQRLQPNATRV